MSDEPSAQSDVSLKIKYDAYSNDHNQFQQMNQYPGNLPPYQTNIPNPSTEPIQNYYYSLDNPNPLNDDSDNPYLNITDDPQYQMLYPPPGVPVTSPPTLAQDSSNPNFQYPPPGVPVTSPPTLAQDSSNPNFQYPQPSALCYPDLLNQENASQPIFPPGSIPTTPDGPPNACYPDLNSQGYVQQPIYPPGSMPPTPNVQQPIYPPGSMPPTPNVPQPVFQPGNIPTTQNPNVAPPFVGQNVSFSPSGNQLWIELLNMPRYGYYVGGDKIIGRIALRSPHIFACRSISFNLQGIEKVKFNKLETIEDKNKEKVTKLVKYKDSAQLFNQSLQPYSMNGQLKPGFYYFPFEMNLPVNLSGAIYEERGAKDKEDYYKIKIAYTMTATINSSKENIAVYKCPLIIRQKYSEKLKTQEVKDDKRFINGDRLEGKLILNRNAFFPGDEVLATLKARTNSGKEVRKIDLMIYRTLHLTINKLSHRVSTIMFQSAYNGFWPCFYGVRNMRFFIPNKLSPTVTSSHISVTYSLRMNCDIPMAIDFDLRIPILLISPQVLYSAVPPLPPPDQLPQTISFRAKWTDGPRCVKCGKEFGIFTRKHHCRHCGRVFCDKCSSKKVKMPNIGFDTAERVCSGCLNDAKKGGVRKQIIITNA